jgi:hypothetical protein
MSIKFINRVMFPEVIRFECDSNIKPVLVNTLCEIIRGFLNVPGVGTYVNHSDLND